MAEMVRSSGASMGNAFAAGSLSEVQRTGTKRVASVDLLRGIVMIIMALDHTRDYFSNLRFSPEDMSKSFPALFATRWITHFCAPAFFFLAGVGASLSLQGGKSKRDLSRFLLTRGLWLVFLELTLLHVGWTFSFAFPRYLVVIWALGWSMVILSGMIYLPKGFVAALSIAAIVGHNLLDGIRPERFGSLAPLWHILHVPGFIPDKFIVAYPLIPWFAVMSLGFAVGDVFSWEPQARRRFLVRAGLTAIAAFVLLRYFNLYGNPAPWSSQKTAAMSVASFLNLLKYPPSLMYLLMTLGPILIALAVLENARGKVVDAISVYGRVPMFYYICHLFLIHSLATLFALWQGGKAGFLGLDLSIYPAWYGASLPGVYAAWIIVILLLYLPCRWFANLKSRRKDWWFGYI